MIHHNPRLNIFYLNIINMLILTILFARQLCAIIGHLL